MRAMDPPRWDTSHSHSDIREELNVQKQKEKKKQISSQSVHKNIVRASFASWRK